MAGISRNIEGIYDNVTDVVPEGMADQVGRLRVWGSSIGLGGKGSCKRTEKLFESRSRLSDACLRLLKRLQTQQKIREV